MKEETKPEVAVVEEPSPVAVLVDQWKMDHLSNSAASRDTIVWNLIQDALPALVKNLKEAGYG